MTAAEPVLRLGIAGLGQAGAALFPALPRNPRVRLTAVADPRPALTAAVARDFRVEAYTDAEHLAESRAVDAVYVATPTHLHAGHALAAIAAGKHVVVEKPMALTLAEADEMVSAAGAAGVALVVGHSQSFEPPVRAMRDLVRAGEIGRLRMLHNWHYSDWIYRPRLPVELDPSLGGGALFRQGAHQVDLLRWIAGGLARSVRAEVGVWDSARKADGSHVLFLTFEDGVVATAVFSGYGHFHTSELTHGIGEDGRPVDPSRLPSRQRTEADEAALKERLGYHRLPGEAPPRYAGSYGLTLVSGESGDARQVPEGLRVYLSGGQKDVPVPALPDGRDALIEELAGAAAGRQAPRHDGAWGRANLEVCLAARESAMAGKEVLLHRQVAAER